MITISKTFAFSASHHLRMLPDDHPCSRLHGHNYELTIYLSADETDEAGFIIDYRKLQPIKDYVDTILDHRNLNDAFQCNPTVENMAMEIYDKFKNQFPQLKAVALSETPKTKCVYEP